MEDSNSKNSKNAIIATNGISVENTEIKDISEVIKSSDYCALTPPALVRTRADKTSLGTRKNARKQDKNAVKGTETKEKKLTTTELIKALTAEWSEDDEDEVLPFVSKQVKIKATTTTTTATNTQNNIKKEEEAKCRPVSRRRPATIPTGLVMQETETSNTADAISGFKRRRVVKPRIIWDPDVPETRSSFAGMARSSNIPTKIVESEEESHKKVIKKEKNGAEKPKSTPVVKRPSTRAAVKILNAKPNEGTQRKVITKATPAPNKVNSSTKTVVNKNSQPKLVNKVKEEVLSIVKRTRSALSASTSRENEKVKEKESTQGQLGSELHKPQPRSKKSKEEKEKAKASLTKLKQKSPQPPPPPPPKDAKTHTFATPNLRHKRRRGPNIALQQDSLHVDPRLLSNVPPSMSWFRGNMQSFIKTAVGDWIFYERIYEKSVYICLDYNSHLTPDHPRAYTMNPKVLSP